MTVLVGCWSGPGLEWLASLPLPAVSREVVADGLALIVIWPSTDFCGVCGTTGPAGERRLRMGRPGLCDASKAVMAPCHLAPLAPLARSARP